MKSYIKQYVCGLIWIISSALFCNLSHATSVSSNSNPEKVILVFGDSLSAAYNIKIEQGWVSLLQDLLNKENMKIKVINASISGETTSGGRERLKKQLELHAPDVVLIELGGNDGLRGLDLSTTKNNLEAMIQMSREHSSKVLLAGIKLPPNYGRTYNRRFAEIYTNLSKKYETGLIPFILDKVAAKPGLMQSDGIHPTAKGQPLILDTVWPYLKPLLVE